MRVRIFTAITAIALAALGLTAVAAPAQASCAGTPAPSEHPFTGTVQAVDPSGRIATVRTDDGRTVVVRGGPTDATQISSVDRTYTVGARYEFHPVNNSDPYEDNICTATHKLATSGGPQPTTSPAGTTAPANTTWIWLAAGAVMLLVVGLAVAWRRRRESRPGAV